MSVLNVEKPAFMAEEDIAIFEDAVGKFFDEHAPEATVLPTCGSDDTQPVSKSAPTSSQVKSSRVKPSDGAAHLLQVLSDKVARGRVAADDGQVGH